MSNLAEKLFEGLAAAAREGIGNAGPQIGTELKQMGAHGAHELAAALFNGSAFVMYPRGSREDHGVHGPEQPQEMAKDGQEQEQHRGRSM
jgi:hypothetical protein